MEDLLTKLSIEEKIEEECILPNLKIDYKDRLAYILTKELPKFNEDFIVNPYLLSSQIFYSEQEYLNSELNGSIDEISLIRSALFGAASHFVSMPQKYIGEETDELVKCLAVDIYSDFITKADVKHISLVEKKSKKKNAQPTLDVSTVSNEYLSLKDSRADVDALVDTIFPLYSGVEPALSNVDNIDSLKQLAAANVLIDSYFREESCRLVKEQISQGIVTPNSSFVYAVLLYNKSLVEDFMKNNYGINNGDKNE